MDLGSNIKKYRKKRGLTQKELALKIGLTASTITKYENNSLEPNIETLEKISKALNISTLEIVPINDAFIKHPKELEESINKLFHLQNSDIQTEKLLSALLISIISGIYSCTLTTIDPDVTSSLCTLFTNLDYLLFLENAGSQKTQNTVKIAISAIATYSDFIIQKEFNKLAEDDE